MSTAQRSALIALAVVVLGIGFVIAQGGDEAETPTTSGQAAATTTTSAPPATTAASTTTAPSAATTPSVATAAAPPPAPAPPVIRVQDGKPVGGVEEITVEKGDTVRFRVESDVADEVHVHGYDLMKDVAANGKATFSFKADIDGIFEVELEDAGLQIASLKVTT